MSFSSSDSLIHFISLFHDFLNRYQLSRIVTSLKTFPSVSKVYMNAAMILFGPSGNILREMFNKRIALYIVFLIIFQSPHFLAAMCAHMYSC